MSETVYKAPVRTHPIPRRGWIGLVIILLVAAVLRAGDGAAMAHVRYDQAQLSLLALELVKGSQFPLVGIESSAGVPNSPCSTII